MSAVRRLFGIVFIFINIPLIGLHVKRKIKRFRWNLGFNVIGFLVEKLDVNEDDDLLSCVLI